MLRAFMDAAADHHIQVWMLTGEPRWGLDPYGESMEEEIDRAFRYNQNLPEGRKLVGVVMDSEPYLLEEWDENPKDVMTRWVAAMTEAHDRAQQEELRLMACIPYYLDTEGFTLQLTELLLNGCDEIAIMNYYKKSEAEHVRVEVGLARVLEKPVTIIYELQEAGQHGLRQVNTYHDDGLQAVRESWEKLTETLGEEGITLSLHEYRALREVEQHE